MSLKLGENRNQCSKVNWDLVEDLGKVTDSEIARRYNISPTAVMYARRRRNIPSINPVPRLDIDWDKVPLGKYIDLHIADMYGCSVGIVHRERNKRKIPPHGLLYRTAENQGAYYEEALIDAWMHLNNVSHTFQHKIGPYRVDWLLSDKEVWEFAGMWDHGIYGAEYRSNFEAKNRYLTDLGYSVRLILRSEMPEFRVGVDLKSIISLTDFVCNGCERHDVKHHAFGLCDRCAFRKKKGIDYKAPVKPSFKEGKDVFVCLTCGSTDRYKQVRNNCMKCADKVAREKRKANEPSTESLFN